MESPLLNIMQQRRTKLRVYNWYTTHNLIPMGVDVNKRYDEEGHIFAIPENLGHGNTIIAGSPGSGKTNIVMNLTYYDHHIYGRKGLIFDMRGEDHRHSKHPNPSHYNVFMKEKDYKILPKLDGITELENVSPCFTDEIPEEDYVMGLTPADLGVRDWINLKLPGGAIASIMDLIKQNPEIAKNSQELYQFIKSVPRGWVAAQKTGGEFFISSSSHDSLLLKLVMLEHDHFFTNKKDEKITRERLKELLKKYVLCFNFGGETQYASALIGNITDKVYNLRVRKEIPPLSITVEEADEAAPAEDKNRERSSTYNLIKCIRKGRKHSFNMRFVTQKFGSLHEDIYSLATLTIIGGVLTRSDLKKLEEIYTPEIVKAAKKLKPRDLKHPIPEFMFIEKNKRDYHIVRPFMSPTDYYHEEEYNPYEWMEYDNE